MKTKHNKKRNSAFIYEALIREATVSILKKDLQRRDTALGLLKQHFGKDTLLRKDLDCYRSLYENQNLDKSLSEKVIVEAKTQRQLIDTQALFKQQTALIHAINKQLSTNVFDNFVPNYKTLATIAQIFSHKVSPKNQVILESEIANKMSQECDLIKEDQVIDKLVYKTFVEKFNHKYDGKLLDEQKELLNYFIGSFSDNALQLKVFLNEEIPRLKTELAQAKMTKEISEDSMMLSKTNKLIEKLEGFSQAIIDEQLLVTIIKTQQLVKEIGANGNNN